MAWSYSSASSSNLSAGDLTILDGLAAFSVHAWCKITSTAQDCTVLGKYDGTNGLRFYHDAVAVNGKLLAPKLAVLIGGVTVRAEPSVDNLFSTGVWHSFGGQWKPNDAAGIKVWFNGVNQCSGSTTAHGGSTVFPNLAADLYIGRNSSSQSLSWNGLIGEVGIWNEFLDPDDWVALNAGVPVWFVRPWALIFVCGSRQVSGGTEWYHLPQVGTSADLTHGSVTWSEDDNYPYQEYRFPDEEMPGGSTPTWTDYALVKAHQVGSSWRDTTVVNDKTYKYKVLARDTSGNTSGLSAESASVTPTGGISGSPMVPALLGGTKWIRPIRDYRNRRHGVWRGE